MCPGGNICSQGDHDASEGGLLDISELVHILDEGGQVSNPLVTFFHGCLFVGRSDEAGVDAHPLRISQLCTMESFRRILPQPLVPGALVLMSKKLPFEITDQHDLWSS